MKRILSLSCILLLAALLACGIYVRDYYRAQPEAVAALSESSDITVSLDEDGFSLLPENPAAGFIFYPGGKVDHRSYAPLMRALAEKEILCIVPKMPGNLAVLDANAAENIPRQYPEIERWYIGGHSLGGSMAASFAAQQEGYEGLILLAAYSTADLTGTDLAVCSLYGSQDSVLDLEKYRQYRQSLPGDTLETVLDGANHAGFGSYGPQEGDGESTLAPGEQAAKTAEIIFQFIQNQSKQTQREAA